MTIKFLCQMAVFEQSSWLICVKQIPSQSYGVKKEEVEEQKELKEKRRKEEKKSNKNKSFSYFLHFSSISFLLFAFA
ncbi:MAG: hypothetical protein V4585_22020 [Bacteroidota bacterium]